MKAFRSRVNSAMRRSSSIISTPPRSSTPNPDSTTNAPGERPVSPPLSTDSNHALKGHSTPPPLSTDSNPALKGHTGVSTPPPILLAIGDIPSPIAESPAREAAAVEDNTPDANAPTPTMGLGSLTAEPDEKAPSLENVSAERPTEGDTNPSTAEMSPSSPNPGAFSDLPVPKAVKPPQYASDNVEDPSEPGSDGPFASPYAHRDAQRSKESLSGSRIWGARPGQEHVTPSMVAGDIPSAGGSNWGVEGGVQIPTEDTFPAIVSSTVEAIGQSAKTTTAETAPHQSAYMDAPIAMQLPQRSEVILSNSVRNIPSSYSVGNGSNRPVELEADETRPLLSRTATPQPYLRQNTSTSLLPPHPSTSQVSTHVLQSLGWLEYILPDGTAYYVHPTSCITTDIDLRNQKKLQTISAYVEDDEGMKRGKGVGKGWEIWLKDVAFSRGKFKPVRMWVDHKARRVTRSAPFGRREDDEDRLDQEYRYWAFMEAHPAHMSLPLNARAEATDALTWSYTDQLLLAQRPGPPPFTQEECQELTNLLRSFDGSASASALQSIVHTRLVSRILLRVSQWRQAHFRPEKPLPRDAITHRRHKRRYSFLRAFVDLVVSLLFLGIPYIFISRSTSGRVDEESGLRSTGPILVVGASSCVIAAVVLSASITFVSLPGLDSLSRVAGLVAILCATSSIVSAVLALMRYKLDLERERVLGGEGLALITKRTVVLSLPLVFLTYSLGALVAGIVLYSFRGVTNTNAKVMTRYFEVYTKWSVVGTLGGLVAVLLLASVL